jgi:hypothetical protein
LGICEAPQQRADMPRNCPKCLYPSTMPNPTVRLGSWSGGGRDDFTVEVDLSATTAMQSSEGCVIRLPIKVQPDEVGYGTSLLAFHGRIVIAENSVNNTGIQIPMQTWYPNYSYIDVPLTFAELARAEIGRQSGDVTCLLSLSALANLGHRPLPQQQQQGMPTQAWVTTVVRDNGTGTTFTLPREQWLKMLKSVGFERVRLVELPVVSGVAGAEWQECLRHLHRATGELGLGKSDAALAACRQVLEGLVTVLAQRWGVVRGERETMGAWVRKLQPALKEAWPEDTDAAEVLIAVYRAVWAWTSDSHHYGSPIAKQNEAAFAVGLTGDLLTHAGHLLQSHPEPLKGTTTSGAATDGSAAAVASS